MRKPKGNEKLGRPRLRWKDNIKMDFQEIVTTLRAGGRRNRHSMVTSCTLFHPELYTPAVGPSQSRVQRVPNSLSLGLKS